MSIIAKLKQQDIVDQLTAVEAEARRKWAAAVGKDTDLRVLWARKEALREAIEIARGLGPREGANPT